MKQDPIAIERALAAAIGDDDALMAELHGSFLDSAGRHALALAGAATPGDWREAAWRLKGCAASFAATGLMDAADLAAAGRVRDPAALAVVADALADIAAGSGG